MGQLMTMIDDYGSKNDELNSLKKVVEAKNKDIKGIMLDLIQCDEKGNRCVMTGAYQATLAMRDRSTINEERLIAWLKAHKLGTGIIKKKEYVDSDALENAIYNGVIPQELVADMDTCKDVNMVPTLTVKKVKGA